MRNDLPLPSILRKFLLGSAVLVAICGAIEVICRLVFHLHYPFDFPITNPGAITLDLLSLKPHFDHLHQREFFDIALDNRFTYPAPMAIPYVIFFLIPGMARPFFYIFCLAIIAVAASGFGRELIRRGIQTREVVGFLIGSFLLSYPFWFELKQGNMEIVIFALMALGVWAFLHDRAWLAATCFGIAGSMKLFPFFMLGLLLARKEYIKSAYAFLVAGFVTLGSLWIIYPSIPYAFTQLNVGLSDFRNAYLLNFRDEQAFDHSLWTFLKFSFFHDRTPPQLASILTVYLCVVAVIGISLYLWRIRVMPVANQVLCLVVAAILFMPVSFDYTLIHVYTPWALLTLLAVDAVRTGRRVPGLAFAFGCFVLLCSPVSELIYRGATVEGRIKTITLIVLFVVGLIYPFPLPEMLPSQSEAERSAAFQS
jgi:hypothetical protein